VHRQWPSEACHRFAAVGRACVVGAGVECAPMLPQTVSALTTAFGASPADGAPLFDFANAILEIFCDQPGMGPSFASLLDQLASLAAPLLNAPAAAGSDGEHLDVKGELLGHGYRLCALLPTALGAANSLHALVGLASHVLATCRTEGPHGVDSAVEFLAALVTKARSPLTPPPAREHLFAALTGAAGETLLSACITAAADPMPLPTITRLANLLAPLLHLPGWRDGAAADGRPAPMAMWAHAALAAIPEVDGVPDGRAKMRLLDALCASADAMPAIGRGGIVLEVVEALRAQLDAFARVCRRLPAA